MSTTSTSTAADAPRSRVPIPVQVVHTPTASISGGTDDTRTTESIAEHVLQLVEAKLDLYKTLHQQQESDEQCARAMVLKSAIRQRVTKGGPTQSTTSSDEISRLPEVPIKKEKFTLPRSHQKHKDNISTKSRSSNGSSTSFAEAQMDAIERAERGVELHRIHFQECNFQGCTLDNTMCPLYHRGRYQEAQRLRSLLRAELILRDQQSERKRPRYGNDFGNTYKRARRY